MSRPILTTAPAEAPVSLAEAKAHLRVETSDEDTLITSLVAAAVAHLDGWTGILGRCMVTQTWTVGLTAWPSSIQLPFPDVSGAEINYFDADGVEQTVDTDLLEVTQNALGGTVRFKDAWTSPTLYGDMAEPVSVAITAGYGGASAVPAPLKHAILVLASHYFENRTAVSEVSLSEVPLTFYALVAPYRCRTI